VLLLLSEFFTLANLYGADSTNASIIQAKIADAKIYGVNGSKP